MRKVKTPHAKPAYGRAAHVYPYEVLDVSAAMQKDGINEHGGSQI